MKKILIFLMLTLPLLAVAQLDSADLTVSVNGYAEPYFGYDINQPTDGNRPGFVYSHNRHNEVNLNLAYLKATVNAKRMRGNLALMAGTYANANLAAEPGTLRNLFEANAGIKLSKKHDLWLDAGLFGSHIGFESAIGKDCRTLTRSIAADNSPYYESGAKLTYTSGNGEWLLSGLVLNGWQRIQRVPGNSTPALGWQVQYKPSSRITLNSSSFFGSDKPDEASLYRVFHNFYGIFQLNNHWGITLGLDTGWEENPTEGEDAFVWYTPQMVVRYAPNNRVALAARAEYYSDEHGVIISTGTENGFKTMGFSANLDVQVHKNAVWRLEGKLLSSEDDIFRDQDGNATNSNTVLTTALAIWF